MLNESGHGEERREKNGAGSNVFYVTSGSTAVTQLDTTATTMLFAACTVLPAMGSPRPADRPCVSEYEGAGRYAGAALLDYF